MKPNKTNHQQDLLFQQRLSDLLNPRHVLYILSKLIDWEDLENEFSSLFKVGSSLKSRKMESQIIESKIKCQILNKMRLAS